MSALVYTVIAIAPGTFVADIALPITTVRKCFAYFTENAGFQSLGGLISGHQSMRRSSRFSEWCGRSSISVADQDMRILMIWGISSWRRPSFIQRPSCPPKAIPVFTAFAGTVAAEA
jgi:hypothetical protein